MVAPLQQMMSHFSWQAAAWQFPLGLCTGSFLNVLALRTLSERSIIWPPSSCPHCERRLGLLDLIPLASYLLLHGRCRYCHEKISWQYPFVEFLTGVLFVVLLQSFGWDCGIQSGQNHLGGDLTSPHFVCTGWAMVFFVSTLIAICITDFREKLIPHEITYPALLLGIVFSSFYREGGLLNCLAGIGISYVLFDFLAFYGLKFYEYFYYRNNGQKNEIVESTPARATIAGTTEPGPIPAKHYAASDDREVDTIKLGPPGQSLAVNDTDPLIDETFNVDVGDDGRAERMLDEDFEVMGGGDAVLAALIAAWLGLTGLGLVLLLGFIIGTVMGAAYLVAEMRKHKTLGSSLGKIALYSVLGLVLAEGFLWMLYAATGLKQLGPSAFFSNEPWWQLGLGAVFGGMVLGIVAEGSKYSKPFPFGPALALAALVAIFWNPLDTQG